MRLFNFCRLFYFYIYLFVHILCHLILFFCSPSESHSSRSLNSMFCNWFAKCVDKKKVNKQKCLGTRLGSHSIFKRRNEYEVRWNSIIYLNVYYDLSIVRLEIFHFFHSQFSKILINNNNNSFVYIIEQLN